MISFTYVYFNIMIDLNGKIIGITRDNGSDVNIDIEPVSLDLDGNPAATGVYNLYLDNDAHDDMGQLAFHLEDKYEWDYIGDKLSVVELEQIVLYIQAKIVPPIQTFGRPNANQIKMLEKSIYHAFKMTFREDKSGISKILFNGKPVVPGDGESVDLKDLFKKIVDTYSTM